MNLFLDIAIACLAVFGFYCLILSVSEWLFPSGLWIAVAVKDEKDADLLDMRLHEAASASFRKRGMRTVLLISAELFENGTVGTADGMLHEQYAALAEQYGADCFIIDWNTK